MTRFSSLRDTSSLRVSSLRAESSARVSTLRVQVVSSCVIIVALLERTCSVSFRYLTQVSTSTSKDIACRSQDIV